MWILFTLLAAFAQSWRNALQSKLSVDVKASGVTLARFLYAGPIAALYLFALYCWQPAPMLSYNSALATWVVGAALMQILATGLMVRLFQMKNFAIGAGLAKTEALVAAIFGVLFFGTQLSPLGWVGVVVGGIAVMLLSSSGGFRQISLATLLTGLACGSAFALTSLWVRQASLHVPLPFPHRAAWVLLLVISLQTAVLVTYLWWNDRDTLTQLFKRTKLTMAVSCASCIGSIGWFSAMALEVVPLVKTLGQIEVFFTLIIAAYWLKQRPKLKDIAGLILIGVAAVLVMVS